MHLTKRQKEILDYIGTYIGDHGYAPTLEEMGAFFGLSSPATVYKHVQQLVQKGYLRKARHQGRGIELVAHGPTRSIEAPILGVLKPGQPLEAAERPETVELPARFASTRPIFVLQVRGDSLLDNQVVDRDLLVIEDRITVEDGETVVAVVPDGATTIARLYREEGGVRLRRGQLGSQSVWHPEGRVQVRGVVIGLLRCYEPPGLAR